MMKILVRPLDTGAQSPGWYLMLPFFGPSDNRDLTGRVIGIATDPVTYVSSTTASIAITGVSVVKTRC